MNKLQDDYLEKYLPEEQCQRELEILKREMAFACDYWHKVCQLILTLLVWLIDWLTRSKIDWLIYSLTLWLVDQWTGSFCTYIYTPVFKDVAISKYFTVKVNVKNQRHFDRSTAIFKLKSNTFLYALKYIQSIIKIPIRYWLKLENIYIQTIHKEFRHE